MEDYIVSARKYRPTTFNTVIGQHSITSTLKNAIKTRQLAQAFLFTGPRGVGKTTCARIMAKTINCLNLQENIEPCNACDSCKAFNQSASFNVHELDAASNNSVEDIRSLVEQVRIPPQSVQYKVYIIDEVHMLSQSAFNAFLKTLEEPPSYAKFILATTEKHKIIPTILSRCQIYDFNRIKVDDMTKHLAYIAQSENITADTEALHIIAQKADGALRDALSIFDQIATFTGNNITYESVLENLSILDIMSYFDIVDKLLNGDMQGVLINLNDIIEEGHDALHFILGLGDHFRNLLMALDKKTVDLLETTQAHKERFVNQAQRCNAQFIINSLDIINKCDSSYKGVGNKRLLVELTLIQICALCEANSEGEPTSSDAVFKKKNIKETPPVKKTTDTVAVENKNKSNEANNKQKIASEKVPEEMLQPSISISAETTSYEAQGNNTETLEEQNYDTYTKEDFEEEALSIAWQDLVKSEITNKPSFKAILKNLSPKKIDNKTIAVGFIGDLHLQEFKSRMPAIRKIIRDALKIKELEFELFIAKADEIKKTTPFTPKEKFEKMASKNINLKNLKENLELDFDY